MLQIDLVAEQNVHADVNELLVALFLEVVVETQQHHMCQILAFGEHPDGVRMLVCRYDPD